MMELRLFPLLVGFALGAMTGVQAKRKRVTKAMAKAYLAWRKGRRGMMANMREDMRDAIEEARYERAQEAALREQAAVAAAIDEVDEADEVSPAAQATSPRKARRRTTSAPAADEPAGDGA
jgi:hypothetical protein